MNKAPAPETVFRIGRWCILLFIAYAFLTSSHLLPSKPPPHQPHPAGTVVARDKDRDCAAQNSPLQNFSMVASLLIPTAVPIVKTRDIRQGAGAPAYCGQQASLRYAYKLESGSVVFSNLESKEVTHVTIGDNSLLQGLELGLIGMQPGGERTVEFPPVLGFDRVSDPHAIQNTDKFALKVGDIKHSILVGTASLVGLTPAIPSSPLPLRIIDPKFSNGTRALCGDTVRAEMTLWKLDGTKVFSTTDEDRPLVFRIGASQMPFGIEQATLGMTEDAERMLVLPPAYAKPLIASDDASRNLLGRINLPDEIMLADIHLEHIGEEAQPVPQKPLPLAKKPEAKDAASDKDNDDKEEKDDKDDDTPAKP